MDAVLRLKRVEAVDRRANGNCAGPDDQAVVVEELVLAGSIGDEHLLPFDLDAPGPGVQSQLQAGLFEVGDRAMGEAWPVGDLAGEVVGDAADREVRITVGDDDCHLAVWVELACTQGGADSGVAASDDQKPRHASSL